MKKILLAAMVVFVCLSCSKDEELNHGDNTTYIFGHFYGFCAGEECIEIFKWDGAKLYEDQKDKYPFQEDFYAGDFEELPQDIANRLSGQSFSVSDSMFLSEQTVFGIPDAYDQGGLYFEVRTEDVRQFWIMDQSKDDIPAFLHPLHEEINEYIQLINE